MSTITVTAKIAAPLKKVWNFWTSPEHVMQWNNASDDWHTPYAENDLKVGGKFLSRMASKDGKHSFDFVGIYSQVKEHELISYAIADGRQVSISFKQIGEFVEVTESFEAESENSEELQYEGWNAILQNFKNYTESH